MLVWGATAAVPGVQSAIDLLTGLVLLVGLGVIIIGLVWRGSEIVLHGDFRHAAQTLGALILGVVIIIAARPLSNQIIGLAGGATPQTLVIPLQGWVGFVVGDLCYGAWLLGTGVTLYRTWRPRHG